MKLRAHHLLCLFGFQGLGYSGSFVKNFEKTLQQIKNNPQLMIGLVNQPDIICARCPHQKNGACQKDGWVSERQVKNRDNLVIKRLGIKKDKTFCARDIFNLVNQNIFPEDLAEICSGCEWLKYGYCVEGLKKRRLGK